jgi:hypothetical protein
MTFTFTPTRRGWRVFWGGIDPLSPPRADRSDRDRTPPEKAVVVLPCADVSHGAAAEDAFGPAAPVDLVPVA